MSNKKIRHQVATNFFAYISRNMNKLYHEINLSVIDDTTKPVSKWLYNKRIYDQIFNSEVGGSNIVMSLAPRYDTGSVFLYLGSSSTDVFNKERHIDDIMNIHNQWFYVERMVRDTTNRTNYYPYANIGDPLFLSWMYTLGVGRVNEICRRENYCIEIQTKGYEVASKYVLLSVDEAHSFITYAKQIINSKKYQYIFSAPEYPECSNAWVKSLVAKDNNKFPMIKKIISSFNDKYHIKCIGVYGAIGKTSKDRAFNKSVVLSIVQRWVNQKHAISEGDENLLHRVIRIVFTATDSTGKIEHYVALFIDPFTFEYEERIQKTVKSITKHLHGCEVQTITYYKNGVKTIVTL